MLRSMFTAISSLNSHQFFMDVVADNLANANTTAYKASRVTFQNQFAETLQSGAAPSEELGGVNPTQIGLGNRLAGISPSFSQGMLQGTGRHSDLAIQGDGMFIFSNGISTLYSRDGSLNIDSEGYLVNEANGYRLQGWTAVTSGSTATVDTALQVGDIQLPLNTSLSRATTQAMVGGNLDSSTTIGDTYEATLGVYDSLGVLQSLTLEFTRASDTTWDWSATSGSASGTGTVTFDTGGQYQSGTGTVTIPGSGGAANTEFSLDFTDLSQLAMDSDASVTSQDGLSAGSFTSFHVTPTTGEVYGLYSNGMQLLLGQVAVADFVNPAGLERVGQNMYEVGLNSGEPVVGAPGTGGRGGVVGGYLEASNVDLAQEFTNMILAQRGFQASSRVITTSDEMLQELVNIKR